MPCFWCNRAGFQIPDSGHCTHCNLAVCTAPPKRKNGDFHGETCRCGCDALFCVHHFSEHSEGHNSHPGECFPGMVALFGPPAFAAAVDALINGVSKERAKETNEFLNTVVPGHKALLSKVGALPEGAYRLDTRTWGATGDTRVILDREFLTQGTLERVAVLAGRATGIAWRNLHKQQLDHFRSHHKDLPVDTFDDLALWSHRGDRPPSAVALNSWIGIGREGKLWRELGEATEQAKQLSSVLSVTRVPEGAGAITDWLFEGIQDEAPVMLT